MGDETLGWDRDGAVVRITLDRPDAANGLDDVLAAELAAAAARCDQDASVRAVVLTGSGRFFSAGGDLRAMGHRDGPVSGFVKGIADDLHRAMSTFARMSAPLVVAVNGVAAGAGFSLAVSGDLVLAASSASFTMAYTRAGLSPDGGATYLLPRLIGLRRTQELILTNRTLSADEAAAWGLVTRVVPDEELAGAATELAGQLAAGSAGAHATVKRLLLTSFGNGPEEQMELEGRGIAACAGSPDGQEGIRAFLEKRRPEFA
ncbi:MAG: enoyl-CoA hydratase/isomerase family protein [Pseudonocardia sp.]